MAIVFKTNDTTKGVVYPSHIETDEASVSYNYDATTGTFVLAGQSVQVFAATFCH